MRLSLALEFSEGDDDDGMFQSEMRKNQDDFQSPLAVVVVVFFGDVLLQKKSGREGKDLLLQQFPQRMFFRTDRQLLRVWICSTVQVEILSEERFVSMTINEQSKFACCRCEWRHLTNSCFRIQSIEWEIGNSRERDFEW